MGSLVPAERKSMKSRKAVRLCLIVVALLAGAPRSPAQTSAGLNLENLSAGVRSLVDRVAPSVVHIVASGYAPAPQAAGGTALASQVSGGSGMIVDSAGYILTNHHVVKGARRVQIVLGGERSGSAPAASVLKSQPRMRDAEIIGVDEETDLALLKIDETDMPTLAFADSDDVRPGELVLAFGSPLGLRSSVSLGIISSSARQLEPESPMIYLQTDAAVNPGNSGGPLVNAEGLVVGINTLILSQSGGSEGVGFAAPSNIALHVYGQLREDGRVIRGEIGAAAQTITPELVEGLGLKQDWGALLGDVTPSGPAYIAGLRTGDIALSLDGKPMENGRQMHVNLYSRRIGDVVKIRALRGEQTLEFNVAVLERENDPTRLAGLVNQEKHWVRRLGVLALTLDSKLASMVPDLRKSAGVVVGARSAQGPRSSAEFEAGDIIFEVNTKPTPSLEELRAALGDIEPNGTAVFLIQRGTSTRYLAFAVE